YIRKSLIPYAILMVVIAIGCGCPYSVYPWLSVVYAVCVAGVLYAEGWCEERYFQYKAGRGFYEKKNYALAALDVIVRIAELIVAFVSISVGVIMVWAILGSLFAQDLDESRIVTRTYTYSGSLILIIIAVSLMAVQLLNFGQKIYKRIRWVYVGLIILAVGMLWIEGKFYTEFYEDKIVIADFSGKKEYDYEEIERFEIYEEHESIQMTIYFTDGEKVNLVGNVQEASELYEDKYYSDYNYMADMVERMQERNIPGNLRDVKLIREDVEGLDDQLKEGLEEIILKMGEQ
ncbi:MAG: hypothetical protein SPF70_00980, partial [Lachnospiraceae bacterium]|nr:hypothetical protein [Lachnospiraceae bacterium]